MDYFEQVVPNLLLYSREIELIPSKVNLDDLLNSVVANFRHASLLDLKSFEGDFSLYCDVELFNQMMTAILENAVLGQGNVNKKIVVSVKIMHGLKLLYPSVMLVIIVDDSGPGMTDEYIPLAFNPFFTTRKSREHSGFGLAIAQKIAEAHNGHISIENRQPTGCRVTVYLPLSMDSYEAK
jgi:signal transduction histidine kinase